jgi:hypothetical protein
MLNIGCQIRRHRPSFQSTNEQIIAAIREHIRNVKNYVGKEDKKFKKEKHNRRKKRAK